MLLQKYYYTTLNPVKMEQTDLTVNTEKQTADLGDEKTKIIEDYSPNKVRDETAPLPEIHKDVK